MKAFLFLFLVAISLQFNGQKLYQINPPDGFVLNAIAIMDIEMIMGEKIKPIKTKTHSFYKLVKVRNHSDYIEFNLIIDSMIMTVDAKGKVEVANSNIPSSYESNPKLEGTFDVIGKPMLVKISNNGKLIKDVPTSQLAEFCVLQYSDEPVKVGEAWKTVQEDESSGIKTTTKIKNIIEVIEGDLMKINSVSENEMLGPEPVSAYMYADEKTGMLKKYEFSVTTKIFGTMKMAIKYEAYW